MAQPKRLRAVRALWTLAASGLVVTAAAACGDDDPTAVGGPLFPPGAVRTFEVVLDASEFLVSDTTFDGFDPPVSTSLLVMAEDFEGVLDAHSLVDLGAIPTQVSYLDTAGTTQVDTMPRFTGGEFVLVLESPPLGGALLELGIYGLTESWHAPTATWTARADTAEVGPIAWTEPGGTRGALIGSGAIVLSSDTVRIPIDASGIDALRDSTVDANGVVIVAETGGTRLEASSIELRLNAIPLPRPDTVVTVTVNATRRTFVFTPEAPATPGVLYAGGTPGWRTVLELSPALDTMTVPCPQPAPAGCRIGLSEATITSAELLLEPEPPPPAYRPADTLVIVMRPVLRSPLIPVSRSPLQDVIPDSPIFPGADQFEPPSGPNEDVGMTFTTYFRRLVAARDSTVEGVTRSVALLGNPARESFGFAGFGSMESSLSPRLRLVLTVPEEVLRP